MKVILLKDVAKIGRAGEIKEVSDGHAINFLIPRKVAEKATPEKIKVWEEKNKGKLAASKAHEESIKKSIQSLSGKVVEIKAKVNEKGHLYRELHEKDIVSAIKEQFGMDIPKEALKLESHLKSAGDFKIPANWAGEKNFIDVKIFG